MPITVSEFPEPLTPAAQQPLPQALIGSDALRLLQHELRRYCREAVSGRSFLIAGHRGAGKTTLVQGAFQQVLNEITQEDQSRTQTVFNPALSGYPVPPALRPLLILLQGPNLLPPPLPAKEPLPTSGDAAAPPGQPSEKKNLESAKEKSEPPAADNDKPAAADDPNQARQQMETVLIQITLGLYRSLADEFSHCFRLRALQQNAGNLDRYSEMQMLELAAKFELDLDEYPGTERLREYWRLLDALENGVLFPSAAFPTRTRDQGLRELVALSTACEAHQRIAGKLSREDKKTSGENQKIKKTIEIDAKGSEFLKPITSLLAGGVAAAGVLTAQHEAYRGATLAGLLTALGSSLAFKYSSSRTRQRAVKRADLFIPDLSLSTLDRVLPVLLGRIRRAGLAPVFVVDELDKIDLSDRITDMVKRLKKLVAESSFFCFLTDRKYFEEMTGRTTDAPYPIEYTYFTNQLFIIFRHDDLHRYLDTVLQVSPEPSQADAQTAERERAEAALDRQVWPFVLLHAAQMHPIDLRRQLLAIQNEKGQIKLLGGLVRSRPRFRFEVMIQVAVEMALSDADMQAEIEVRPAFLQIAHDALYYISRRWNKAPDRLHLDDACKSAFATYLRNRMATDVAAPKREQSAHDHADGDADHAQLAPSNEHGKHKTKTHHRNQPASNGGKADSGHPLPDAEPGLEEFVIESATVDFLLERVRDIASLLASPNDLLAKATASRQYLQSVLDATSTDPLLQQVPDQPHVYDWCAFPSSRVIHRTAAPLRVTPTAAHLVNWENDYSFVGQFERSLGKVARGAVDPAALASQYGIMKTSPAWADVQRAMQRVADFRISERPYAELDDDRTVIHGFRTLIVESAQAIARALVSATTLASRRPVTSQDLYTERSILMAAALKVITTGLRFLQISTDQVEFKLRALYEEILKLVDRDGFQTEDLAPPELQNVESIKNWEEWVSRMQDSIPAAFSMSKLTENGFRITAWRYWKDRLTVPSVDLKDPDLATVYCQVTAVGPGKYLSFSLDSVTIADWSLAIVEALDSAKPDAEEPQTKPGPVETGDKPPLWFPKVALTSLRFDSETIEDFMLRRFERKINLPPVMTDRPLRDRALAGIAIRRDKSTFAAWKPTAGCPLIIVSRAEALNLVQNLESPLAKVLQLSFLAVEADEVEFASVTDVGAQSQELSKRRTLEQAIARLFGIDPSRPIPVIFPHPRNIRPLAQRYLPIAPQNPRELFDAVSGQSPQSGGSLTPMA